MTSHNPELPTLTGTTKTCFCTALFIALMLQVTPLSYALEATSNSEESFQQAVEELTVSALRIKNTPRESGTSLTVITAEDIKNRQYTYALDAIAAVSGVTVNQNSSFGGLASIRIRGAAAAQTLVLINGIPVNDPSSPGSGFDFATLDIANIDRIEILKGPQSTLWGSDAIGGVINIIGKEPQLGIQLSAFAEAGSYNTVRSGASVGAANETANYRLGISYQDTTGISAAEKKDGNNEKDGFESLSLDARGGLDLGKSQLKGELRYVDSENEFDGFVFQNGDFGFQDTDEHTESKELSGHITYAFRLFSDQLSNDLKLGYAEIERDNFNNGLLGFSAEGQRLIMRYQGDISTSKNTNLVFGLEREETESQDDKTSINSYFGLLKFKTLDALSLTAGLRLDDHKEYGTETTASFNGAYYATNTITIRASWGEGFKSPTLFQTTFFCCGASTPNPDIKPEESESFDLGIDYRTTKGNGGLSLSYFDQHIRNQIDFSFALGSYENIARIKSKGVEVNGFYAFSDAIELSFNYTYIDANDGAGKKIARLPENTAEVELRWTSNERFSTTLVARYNDEELNSAGTVDDWIRLDLSASFAITDDIDIYARIENLLDKQYQQVLGYGAPGFSSYVGLRWNR
ncbi:MAG: TonB-dependent receptor [Pseudomonadales bacterium]|nr:TonB-dependent receptor [Pseudomonadales bacterium]